MSGTKTDSEVVLRGNLQPSDEVNAEGLALGRQQGEAFGRALRHMVEDVAHDGGQKPAGDYIVGYAVEEAEGMYQLVDGELKWQEPDEENLHLEIAVRDRDDGRIVPGLDVVATLTTADGQTVGTHAMPFLWHPSLYHYGRNWKVPGSGAYRLEVRIAPATFPRHDKTNGKRYGEEVIVEFDRIDVKTGQG